MSFGGFFSKLRKDRCIITVNNLKFRQFANDSRSETPSNNIQSNVAEVKMRRIFSGIQPTGSLHLGNYFGAVSHWIQLQSSAKTDDGILISVVDLHSMTMTQDPVHLRNNICRMTATLLACGIDPEKTVLFQQSNVMEHTGLAWVLMCLTTMARLGRLPQYKEKSEKLKEKPLGLFVYPVLQSADILLYKATHVPVGEDQLQHIQLAQHLARLFNHKYGTTYFPHPKPILGPTMRLKSLRDPEKKMSKSDVDPRSRVEISDTVDETVEKLKKAVTDCTSAVTYDPHARPGVSNLIDIHCLLTGHSPLQVCDESQGLETAEYKLRLADVVNEKLSPIRKRVEQLLRDPGYVWGVLAKGSERATRIAAQNWAELKQIIGISI